MISALLALLVLAAAEDTPNKTKPPKAGPPASEQAGTNLVDVHRIYVDRLTGGETAAQIRDLLIGALQKTKLFSITENEERADTFLRGSAEDLLFTDRFSSSDGLSAHVNGGETSGGTSSRTSSRGAGRYSGGQCQRQRVYAH